MSERFITLVGMNYYYGTSFIKPGMNLIAIKEPENNYDSDAIRVESFELGKVGYIANTPYTKAQGTLSASRIYETLKDRTLLEVRFCTSKAIICEVKESKKARKKVKAWRFKHAA